MRPTHVHILALFIPIKKGISLVGLRGDFYGEDPVYNGFVDKRKTFTTGSSPVSIKLSSWKFKQAEVKVYVLTDVIL